MKGKSENKGNLFMDFFFPTTRNEMQDRGIRQPDIILISGEAYLDHPSSGVAILAHLLRSHGYSVAILDQPDWRSSEDFKRLGPPGLFFGVTSGSLDSMLANYTATGKKRRNNPRLTQREYAIPDKAVIVYCNRIKEVYKDIPIVIGGIEASMRRFGHYDYWSDSLRRSILLDTKADILVYGMGERQILEIAGRISKGEQLDGIKGTVIRLKKSPPSNAIKLPSFKEISSDKNSFAKSYLLQKQEQEPFTGKPLLEEYEHAVIIQYPPSLPLTTCEIDYIYELPFTRRAHTKYKIPVRSLEPVTFSIITHRGCFGDCSFCALCCHQGKFIQSRSVNSIIREVESIKKHPAFKGYIDDLGGPTANMYGMNCFRYIEGKDFIVFPSIIDGSNLSWNYNKKFMCNKNCIKCKNLSIDYSLLINLLKSLRSIKDIKKIFIRSGIRFDLAMKDERYLYELIKYHISGQLKVAPEHVSPGVLQLMNKSPLETFEKFYKSYIKINRELSKKQYLIPYFMVAHPGTGKKEAQELKDYILNKRIAIEQIQIFTPTPMTGSTCMYYTGKEPYSLTKIYIPRKNKEKEEQKRILFSYKKKSL